MCMMQSKFFYIAIIVLLNAALLGTVLFFVLTDTGLKQVTNETEEELADKVSESHEELTVELPAIEELETKAFALDDDAVEVVNKRYGYSYYVYPYDSNRKRPDLYFNVNETAESLEKYVEGVWQRNKYDDNPYTKNKSVSEIRPVTVNGNSGYRIDISQTFTTEGGGWVLNGEREFYFFEATAGAKIFTDIPKDAADRPDYLALLNTLVIDESLILQKQSPSAWRLVADELFSFSYPSNIFEPTTIEGYENNYYFDSIESGVYGFISVQEKEEVFDSQNIQGLYGPITDPEVVSIPNNGIWYSYTTGDAGCGSKKYLRALDSLSTIQVSFAGCTDEVFPAYEEEDLHRAVLNTFRFQ